jgi:hypothetical protein
MVEATHSLTLAQRQAKRRTMAIRVLAQQAAIREVKAQLQREGRIRVAQMPMREIVSMAEARLMADAQYRAKIIAEAKAIVADWHAEGRFGKRGGIRNPLRRAS